MARRQNFAGGALKCMLLLVPLVLFITLVLQRYSSPFKDIGSSSQTFQAPAKLSVQPCVMRSCPDQHFSFYIQSGAANVVAPKICIQNKLVLGSALNNAGFGINIVIMDGKTGEVTKTDHFDMYSGEVEPLIEFLKSVERGSAVLMASYDDPSSKLNENARKLISELGSSAVQSLGFRDNWVFVGGKAAEVKSSFEKFLKNDRAKNKYDNWPELIDIQGCIPTYLE